MNEEKLINYYNKFNENKRFNTRHGQVEFQTTLFYINKYLKKFKNPKIIEIGAGTGKYSGFLANHYDVTAVELVKHNLRLIEKNYPLVKAYQGNAINLNKFNDNTFDITLLFGPMYHLLTNKEKELALNEAKRITKTNGIIMVAYVMNEYAIIKHGFIEHNIISAIKEKRIDDNFNIINADDGLYSMMRLEDINKLNKRVNLKRITTFTPDGPANYIRNELNKMNEEEFEIFLKYILEISERKDILGASAHIVDVLKKV